MEEELKDIIGYGPKDLFDLISSDFSELVKYKVLFGGRVRLDYLEEVNKLYRILITRCRYELPEYYKKEAENIFNVTHLPSTTEKSIVEIVKSVTTTMDAWKPATKTLTNES